LVNTIRIDKNTQINKKLNKERNLEQSSDDQINSKSSLLEITHTTIQSRINRRNQKYQKLQENRFSEIETNIVITFN